jgi:CRISPR-associated protein Cas8a2/Csx9 subtype I-A
MNASRILDKLPFTGLLREIITIGLLELAEGNIFESEESELNERVAELMERMSNQFDDYFSEISSSKIVLNDRSAYFIKTKRLVKWYGEGRAPEDYIRLMIYVLKGTANLLRKKKVDFMDSLKTVSIGREVILGKKFNDSLAIVPAVIKQAEFYEFQHEFLKPTAGEKPEILLDPVWFALIGIGFLRCFAGYYGGRYYFITKEGIEAILDIPERAHIIREAIKYLTETHIKMKPIPYCEELYELRLSYGVATSQTTIPSEVYPLKMYEISLVGNAYTCTRTMLIDLTESINYLRAYIDFLNSMPQTKIQIEIKNQKYDNPMHALLELAEREIQKPVQGDNSMLLLIFVKDLYRAIHAGRPGLIEETLLRLLRISHSILTTKERVNLLLKNTVKVFMHEQHLLAVIHAGKR